jgi:gamma-glutamyltranspeptidase/glutathione hydrolase
MLSSMTPTIVEKEGKLFLVAGSPGGSTIPTSVFQVIVNVILLLRNSLIWVMS